MSNYAKGRNFEYRIRDLFKRKGYVVVRSAQSKMIDLICVKHRRIYFIECKSGGSRLRSKDKVRLLDMARKSGANILLARRPARSRTISLLNIATMKEVSPTRL